MRGKYNNELRGVARGSSLSATGCRQCRHRAPGRLCVARPRLVLRKNRRCILARGDGSSAA